MTNDDKEPPPIEMNVFRHGHGYYTQIQLINHVSMRPGCIMLDNGLIQGAKPL